MNTYDNNKSHHDVLEESFINDNFETGRMILHVSSKGSGKSYLLNKFIQLSIDNNVYDEYHLVLPQFNSEQNDSYAYLVNRPNTYIYNAYAPMISEKINKLRLKKRILFVVDDATGELLNNTGDPIFIKLITTTRHGMGLTIYICAHGAKFILKPICRQQCDYMLVGRITNKKLLEDIYDEYMSMYYDRFKDFKHEYVDYIYGIKYNQLLIDNVHNKIDFEVINWSLNEYEIRTEQPKHKPQMKGKTKDDNKKEQIPSHPIGRIFFNR